MDFFKDHSSSIDSWINKNVYNSALTDSDGINLRTEMNWILYGNGAKRPKGHWVVLRNYDISKKSKYYNKRTREGVGGPAYQYTDHLVRSRRVPSAPLGSRDNLEELKSGIDISNEYIYYFEYNLTPKIGDDIFELDISDHTNKPSGYSFSERYKIERVHPYRLENGNTQYYSVHAIFDEVRY